MWRLSVPGARLVMRNPHDRDARSDFPPALRDPTMRPMKGIDDVRRVADLRLHVAGGPIALRVRWPRADEGAHPPLMILLPDAGAANGVHPADERLAQALCARIGAIVLCVPWAARGASPRRSALDRAEAALHWSADHAGELEADPERLVLVGRGAGAAAASALTRRASERGWPPLGPPVLLVDEPLAEVRA
jgi:acetyl esterase/lipase